MKSRAHVLISGMVQGVYFRSTAREKAIELGLKGWVKNNRDGSVEAVFEGGRDAIHTMIAWCKVGPPYARVKKVDVAWEEHTGEFNSFDIRY